MVGCEIEAEWQDCQDFFDGIIPSGWIGTVVAHVLLSPLVVRGNDGLQNRQRQFDSGPRRRSINDKLV